MIFYEGILMKDRLHTEVMGEYLLANPEYSNAMLAEVLQGGDREELAVLLRYLHQESKVGCSDEISKARTVRKKTS